MDAALFRLPTDPNYYQPLECAAPVDLRTRSDIQQLPAPDSRFPGWAAPMSDARLVTQYQPHCSQNIPAGRQFPTKAWMQANGEELIRASRTASAINMGAFLPFDPSVVPPPSLVVSCTTSGCTRTETNLPGSIGMERAGAPAPELFGTFVTPIPAERSLPPQHTNLTTRYEGGRNSIRGLTGRTAM